MSEAGYTLVEMLVALIMVALAIGGFSAATQVLAWRQITVAHRLADSRASRTAEVVLERLLQPGTPYRSQEPARFRGDPQGFQFDCAADAPCEVKLVGAPGGLSLHIQGATAAGDLPLRTAGGAHFLYGGSDGASGVWPPARGDRQALRLITLVGDGDAGHPALVKARLWREQPVRCAFDVVMQDCR